MCYESRFDLKNVSVAIYERDIQLVASTLLVLKNKKK